jgi:hypothetical protein
MFGIGHPTPTDSQATASPSSSIGTADGGAIGDLGKWEEHSPCSTSESINREVKGEQSVIEEPACVTEEDAVSIPTPQVTASKVTVGTQTSNDDTETSIVSSSNNGPDCSLENNDNNNSANPDPLNYRKDMLTFDPHCYECKVRYRDPKPKDLIMYLHAIKYGVSCH